MPIELPAEAQTPTVPPMVDALVVGGGVNGAGIPPDLARRELKVLMWDQDDFAQHTSSASTKLIHAGLRYLEYCEFSLVCKAPAEREHRGLGAGQRARGAD